MNKLPLEVGCGLGLEPSPQKLDVDEIFQSVRYK